jgi:3-oxoacyl-[acyl-carrier-protein] synthase II
MSISPTQDQNGAARRDPAREVVITGLGIVSPIGIGREPFWRSLVEGRSGVAELASFDNSTLPMRAAAEVRDFDAKQYVRPRKSLKVMSRDIQLGFAAADMAFADAGLTPQSVLPERMGVVFGAEMMYCDLDEVADAYRKCSADGEFHFDRWGTQALGNMYPLWMLKYLPNMPACHIAIALDARGPNNSITLGEVSSLLAMAEAMRVIERGSADVIIAGGTSSRVNPTSYVFRGADLLSRSTDEPTRVMRPFDAGRTGTLNGEGAAALVLERRDHAEARGATILGRLLGYGSTFEPRTAEGLRGTAVRGAIRVALRDAGLKPEQIGHFNANGMSTVPMDRLEAGAIRDVLGDVPVTAPKSFFGNVGAGTGAVEAMVSVLALHEGRVPATLNYEQPDPECPVNVIAGAPQLVAQPTALLLNIASTGQAAAVVLAAAQ